MRFGSGTTCSVLRYGGRPQHNFRFVTPARLLAAAPAPTARGSSTPPPAPPPAPAAAAPVAAPAAAAIASHEQYYDVEGSSVAELREQVRRLGPRDGGQPLVALTVWDLEWTYHEAPGADGCALRDVKVTLAVTTTLPRWAPPKDVSPRVVDSWRSFLQHVKVHEAGHRAIAERNARDLTAALQALRRATCKEVWDEASNTAERLVAEGRARNRAYDLETKHGQTQGVVLAP